MKKFMKGIKDTVFQAALIGVAIMGTLHYIGDKSDSKAAAKVDQESPLTENQVRRLIVDLLRDQLIIQEKEKPTKVYSGIRKAVFTEIKDGSIQMAIPTYGWTFEPGMTLVAGDALRIGLDTQWVYWKRWGVVTGMTVPATQRVLERFRGHLGLSYNFHNKYFPGTSIC